MRFVYKSISEQIVDEHCKAMEQGRELLKVELSRREYLLLSRECPVLPCGPSIANVTAGVKGEFDGITVEVV